jgi:nitroimidazol reductase NimA-like FMN-containing flavoprotein (pyridoxamine 5'-phosphate oxidase superfamily)
MPPAPRAEQLTLPPGYGTPSRLLDWDAVAARLADARHYWLATVRPDGRPHVVPFDGLWLDGRWWFGGSPTSVRHRNLLADPRAAVHLEDAVSAVIVEGTCELVRPSEELAERLAAASREKYGHAVPASVYLGGVWALVPARVLAWTDLGADATRFRFEAAA